MVAVIRRWKIKLRFWLIAIVSEAIRIERASEIKRSIAIVPRATIPASKPVTPVSEPSFERSEAEALAAQEKYYEPNER